MDVHCYLSLPVPDFKSSERVVAAVSDLRLLYVTLYAESSLCGYVQCCLPLNERAVMCAGQRDPSRSGQANFSRVSSAGGNSDSSAHGSRDK